jgi:TolB protein
LTFERSIKGADGFFQEIYVIDADGTNLKRITFLEQIINEPVWAPTGDRILFLAGVDGRDWFVYAVNSDGSELSRLTFKPSSASADPRWSPSGQRILWADRSGKIKVMNADGSNKMFLTSGKSFDYGAEWSPDGRHFAYVSSIAGEAPAQVVMMNPDDSSRRIVAVMDRLLFMTWSPDGKHIAFQGWLPEERISGIYVAKVDGSDLKRIAPTGDYSFPAWSPNLNNR